MFSGRFFGDIMLYFDFRVTRHSCSIIVLVEKATGAVFMILIFFFNTNEFSAKFGVFRGINRF